MYLIFTINNKLFILKYYYFTNGKIYNIHLKNLNEYFIQFTITIYIYDIFIKNIFELINYSSFIISTHFL